MNRLFAIFVVAIGAAACSAPDPVYIRTSTQPLGASIHITTGALDELNCEPGWPTTPADVAALMAGCSGAPNGQISWLEAHAAAFANRGVDCPTPSTCLAPAGLPDALGLDAIIIDGSVGTVNIGRQLNTTSGFSLLGDVNNPPTLSFGGRSRGYFVNGVSDTAHPPTIEVSGVRATNGCVHGGTCLTDLSGDITAGGFLYMLARGSLSIHDSILTGNVARAGGAVDVCTAGTNGVDIVWENVICEDNAAYLGGGGCFEMHGANTLVMTSVTMRRNQARNSSDSMGGNIKITGGTAQLYDVVLEDGNSLMGPGGNIAVSGQGSAAPNQNPIVVNMYGGAMRRGLSRLNGGDAFVQAGLDGTGVSNTYCPTGGCQLNLFNVEVTDGTTSNGNGGLLATNNTGTRPGLVTLNGASTTMTLTGGLDQLTPFNHQLFGLITDNRTSCGNNVVDPGEECDGTVCCSGTCVFLPSGAACSDGNACTVGDTCDGAGACAAGGPSCGDGIVQASCSEECDLGDQNGVLTGSAPCRMNCTLATCSLWE